MTNIKAGDLVIDTFYFKDRPTNPLFVFYYVLDIYDNKQGDKVVKLAPPIYKKLDTPPAYDFLMSEIPESYKVRKCRAFEYTYEDVKDKKGRRIGLHFIPLKDGDRFDYVVIFPQYRV